MRVRQKSLFKRESEEGGGGGRGFFIMKFEICRTSKGSVAKPLWQQSREEECISLSLFLPFSPSLPLR